MDFRLTEQQESFRNEVRDFLKAEVPADWHGLAGPTMIEMELEKDDVWEMYLKISKKLAAKGWLAMAWPKEYGGQERSHIEQAIFFEEMSYHRAPGVNAIGVVMVGPTLIVCGTDEQKKQIFTPFYTTKHDGLGLGLTISRRIIDAFSGNLTVVDHCGGGAEFVITLPLCTEETQ